MFEYSVNIPLSRFRRELNTWMRFLDGEPDNAIYITRNNKVIFVAVSPQRCEREKLEFRKNL